MAQKSKKTSLLTKTGKPLLGPLNIAQLEEMMEKTSRPKEKNKIANRIRIIKSRKGFVEAVPVLSL
jgi:hypothetical protein